MPNNYSLPVGWSDLGIPDYGWFGYRPGRGLTEEELRRRGWNELNIPDYDQRGLSYAQQVITGAVSGPFSRRPLPAGTRITNENLAPPPEGGFRPEIPLGEMAPSHFQGGTTVGPSQPFAFPSEDTGYLRSAVGALTQPDPMRMRGATIDTTMQTPMSVARNYGFQTYMGDYVRPDLVMAATQGLENRPAQIEYNQPLGAQYPQENLQAATGLEKLYQSQQTFPGQMEMQRAQIETERAAAELARAQAQDPGGLRSSQSISIAKDLKDLSGQLTTLKARAEAIKNASDDNQLAALYPDSFDPKEARRKELSYIDPEIRRVEELVRRYQVTLETLGGNLSGAFFESGAGLEGAGGAGGSRGIRPLDYYARGTGD